MSHDVEDAGGGGFQESAEDLRIGARELHEVVGRLDGLSDLLRRTLPRVTDPRDEADFRAAVRELVSGLDETAVHRLGTLVSELWFHRDPPGAPEAEPAPAPPAAESAPAGAGPAGAPGPRPSPAVEDVVAGGDRSPWLQPETLQSVVDVAGYLATAAIGGIVGNKSDWVAGRLIEAARARWRARRTTQDASLTEDEAVDVARAAAHIQGFAAESLRVLTAERQENGAWTVRLRGSGETLRVTVPAGDPARARILFEAF
ncbi:hypothetical protein GTU99_07235 [Streptomyces sp. PRKS01-65]|nr:hypothetical protein [Streptomyces harenosi]NEY31995.1 hypothetical protein [Streptomyces harenosi]